VRSRTIDFICGFYPPYSADFKKRLDILMEKNKKTRIPSKTFIRVCAPVGWDLV